MSEPAGANPEVATDGDIVLPPDKAPPVNEVRMDAGVEMAWGAAEATPIEPEPAAAGPTPMRANAADAGAVVEPHSIVPDAGLVEPEPEPEPQPECKSGEQRCRDAARSECLDGQWAPETVCPYVCIDGECTGSCRPGATQCDGQVPETCDERGEWVGADACPNLCTDGVCSGQCSPSAMQCANGTVQRCSSAGAWIDHTVCPYVCEDGACTGVCSPNETRCSGLTQQLCDEHGQWVELARCPYLCDASRGACAGECSPGDTGCDRRRREKRSCNSAGRWESLGVSVDCGAECTPNETGCAGNIDAMTPGECSAAAGSCWFTWTAAGVVEERHCNASGNWVSTPCTSTCTISAATGGTAAGRAAYSCATKAGVSACTVGGTCPHP